MTWRRFATLLRGLGPQSACASRAYVRKYGAGGTPDEPVNTITDPDAIDAWFANH